MGEKEARLREIRKEIGVLLDEALLVADDLPTSDKAWITTMWDLLAALDAKDAVPDQSSVC